MPVDLKKNAIGSFRLHLATLDCNYASTKSLPVSDKASQCWTLTLDQCYKDIDEMMAAPLFCLKRDKREGVSMGPRTKAFVHGATSSQVPGMKRLANDFSSTPTILSKDW